MITRLLQRSLRPLPIQHLSRSFSSQTATKTAIDDATFRKSKYLVGDSVHGFVCTNAKFIPEFNMTAYVLKHQKTGLEYLHVDRPDNNNVFSVNFRTTPMNSTGLPHILEHTVLCVSWNLSVSLTLIESFLYCLLGK